MAQLKQQRGGAPVAGSRRSIGGGGITSTSLAIPRGIKAGSTNVAKRGGARSGGPPRPLTTHVGAQRILLPLPPLLWQVLICV